MKFKGKSARSLTKLISLSEGIERIRLAFNTSNEESNRWLNVGFNEDLEAGDYLLPEPTGKITEFNANGKEIIRKDLPKEPQPRSFHTTWQDWHGNEHSGVQTRSIDMYPREYVEAPAEFLNVIELAGDKLIVTDETKISEATEARNLHLVNLMFECFGEFEVLDVDSNSIVGTKLKRLHWNVLPQGQYPWERVKKHTEKFTNSLSCSDKAVIEMRLELLSRYKPDFLATGRGGFNGYFVYGFKDKNIFVLESVHLFNATYIFENDWELFSQYTKNEIINGQMPHQRLIHDKKWKWRIRKALS